MNDSITTHISLIIIIAFFIYFLIEICKLWKVNKVIRNAISNKNILDFLKGTKHKQVCEEYCKTINIDTPGGKKSNIPSEIFFNEAGIGKAHKINLKMLDTASGTLVGLGLLGTFLGLTLGIKDFDSTNSGNIQQSIQNLLGGMSTAFTTSLFGMLFSILFTIINKRTRNRLQRNLHSLTYALDESYYVDDQAILNMNIRQFLDNMVLELNEKLTYSNDVGERVTIGNAIREILSENAEQSKALKSFSTDLALELNNGFDEALSRQMQQKILPLMENVDATTKAIVEHIDQMAAQVSAPATDMIKNVVTELKQVMASIVDDFKTSLSGSTTNELENIATQLDAASQSFALFPANMELLTHTLQSTIEDVKNAVSEISNTSANANSSAMQQMKEQSGQMIDKMSEATEKMGAFLESTISNLSTSVRESIKGVTDEVNNKQADLIALQDDTTAQTKKLLETFNQGLERLEQINSSIELTMNLFKQAQGQISGSTAHLQNVTSNMEIVSQLFNKSQEDYMAKMEEIQQNSQQGINDISELLSNTGELSEEYVEKFEIIKEGLSGIFAQLQKGLNEYSRTVQESTQKYLDQFSSGLTQTTDSLASAIQHQSEITDVLSDAISNLKK